MKWRIKIYPSFSYWSQVYFCIHFAHQKHMNGNLFQCAFPTRCSCWWNVDKIYHSNWYWPLWYILHITPSNNSFQWVNMFLKTCFKLKLCGPAVSLLRIRDLELKSDFNPILNIFRVVNRFRSMMTSSNINIFRVTGPLRGEFTGDRWHQGQWHRALMFSLICA